MNNELQNNSENTEIILDKRKTLPQLFKPGQSGNPAGKPKGAKNKISPSAKIQEIWENEPERFDEFVDKYLKDPHNRQHIVEMIDGKPKGSEKSNDRIIVIPILGGLTKNAICIDDSDKEIIETQE